MGLLYLTSGWANSLWTRHVYYSPNAQRVTREGSAKQRRFTLFAQDIHSILYLRAMPASAARSNPPAWAVETLEQATNLPEWATLKARCQASGLAAGIAAETLLEALLPYIPQEETPPPRGGDGRGGQGDGAGQHPGGCGLGLDENTLRRLLRMATKDAQDAVDAAESMMDGFSEGCGLSGGDSTLQSETPHDAETILGAYALMRNNPTLQKIGDLAGRLQRIGDRHKRTRVRATSGGVVGIRLGGDIPAILPGELAGVRSRNRLHRLSSLHKILQRQALQYDYRREESETRGPIIACLDESSSMRGAEDIWSKAVALALLATATQQRRHWHVIGFNADITHEEHIAPGEGNLTDVITILTKQCSGGTDFNRPLLKALEVLNSSETMRKADIIFITDGEDSVHPDVEALVNKAKAEHSVHIYVVGIGNGADLTKLKGIASQMWKLRSQPTTEENNSIAPMLTLTDEPI